MPHADGGVLDRPGTVEVVSSLHRDGAEVEQDLRWGVYVVVETDSAYVRRCFSEYGAIMHPGGRYAALFRPTHFIGLELGFSIARAALCGEATGTPTDFNADVVAVAKRGLNPGERLDGEGGYTVYGSLVSAQRSLAQGAVPLGLTQSLRVRNPVAPGATLRWEDLESAPDSAALRLRLELEARYRSSE